MPLTKSQGLFLSNLELLAGLWENAESRMELSDYLPFYPVEGDHLRVERSQPSDFGVDPLFDPVPLTTTEGLAVPTSTLEANFELKLLAQDIIAEDFVSMNQSNVNSQVGVQLQACCKRMLYKFWKTFSVGDESLNPQEFSGVRKLAVAGQTIQTADTVNYFLDLNDLPRLLSLITANNGRVCALWTNPTGYKNILYAHYAKGVEPDIQNDWDGSGGRLTCGRPRAAKGPRLLVDGVPVFIDEFGPTNETVGSFSNGSSIYAFVCGRGGLYGIFPCGWKDKIFKIGEVLAASTTNITYRVLMAVGLALDRQGALARLQFRPQAATL